MYFQENLPDPFPELNQDDGFGSVVPPNGVMIVRLRNTFSEEKLASLQLGKMHLFAQIRISYTGAFEKEYNSHQCFRCHNLNGGFGPCGERSHNWFT
jgi:hypothetical protein